MSSIAYQQEFLKWAQTANHPRLLTSEGRFGKWVALSHCWGRHLPIKTEQATLKSHCEGISITSLGPTFKDAVMIARALNVQYIWIDALCIIQDSESDWRTEAATMDYVYQHATFTIAAEASSGSEVGIRGSMKALRCQESELPSTKCHSKGKRLEGRLLFRYDLETWGSRGPLSTRAWTMQEEILCPRILRFSRQQILWRCGSDCHSREWFPEGTKKAVFPDFAYSLRERIQKLPKPEPEYEMIASKATKENLFFFWYTQVVNYYAPRELTFPTDRLIAISGIVKGMQIYLPDSDYEEGLWAEDVQTALVWAVPNSGTTAYPAYVAPSWSWAHLDFSGTAEDHLIIYGSILWHHLKPIAELVGFQTKVVTALDSVQRRVLNLKVPSHTICSCCVPEAFIDQRKSSTYDRHYSLERVGKPQNHFVEKIGFEKLAENSCDKHKPYLYIQVAQWDFGYDFRIPVVIALILEEAGSKLDPVYRRVGRALIPHQRSGRMEWPSKTVAII